MMALQISSSNSPTNYDLNYNKLDNSFEEETSKKYYNYLFNKTIQHI